MNFILALLIAGSPLLFVEVASRKLRISAEVSRKLTHVLSALAASLLTTIISLRQIAIIGCVFFVILGLTRSRKMWKSLYGVTRKSFGELWFPLGVAAGALLAQSSNQFITIMLIVGLSDTVAALVGQRYKGRLLKLKYKKSLEGSFAFYICTLVILALLQSAHIDGAWLIVIAVVATLTEFISPYGSDNLTVPVVVGMLLRAVS